MKCRQFQPPRSSRRPVGLSQAATSVAWNVYANEMFFLGDVEKAKVPRAFRPHILFDDQDAHLEPAAKPVP